MAPINRLLALTFLSLSAFLTVVLAQSPETEYVYGIDAQGVTRELPVNRYPALYTGDFGDCLGGESLFNITKFDAAYYADNLTIVFHLDGTSNIRNESLMMQISVDAYGINRFNMVFDPCALNIYSLCPLNASVPVTGWAVIPVGPQQIGGIPPIAFGIPDFEGSTTVQIFANSSQTQIGCFQAVMRNGHTFSHPEAVAPILAAFALAAIIASFATTAYGLSVPHMRMHYAHSLPVFVVFETLQTIFFSGALSVQWPSILVAWWSNFAWSAGMIYVPSMVKAVDNFVGVQGNSSQVGGAGSVVINNGGGLISQIYGRSLVETASRSIVKRASYNASDPYDYTWSGTPVALGMPTPGTWFGFWADLAAVDIPGAAALLVGLIWITVAIFLAGLSVLVLKAVLELSARLNLIKKDQLAYFRSHWMGYSAMAMLRTVLISFFAVMTLTMFQFTNGGTVNTTIVAAITFGIFFLVVMTSVTLACRARTQLGKFELRSDQIIFHKGKLFSLIPGMVPAWASTLKERELAVEPVFSISLSRIRHINHDSATQSVHQDQEYIKKYGWLAARHRRTKWWFFAYYVCYLLGRAAFLGAGVHDPLAQVYGLLIYEIIAFAIAVIINPFEGTRNTALAVWMLSISKILTTGLSIAFLPEFGIDRIIGTVVGVVIIVIQGLLVIGMMILIFLSAMSSWMSLTRNQDEFRLDYLESTRVRYFEKMEIKAADEYRPAKRRNGKGKDKEEDGDTTLQVTEPSFSVVSVRRAPKIEDETEDEDDIIADLEPTLINSPTSPADSPARNSGIVNRAGRTNSVGSSRHRLNHSSVTDLSANRASPSVHFADESSEIAVSGPRQVRERSSSWSLRSPVASPTSPLSPGGVYTGGAGGGRITPSRETLARYAEERSSRYSTPTPGQLPGGRSTPDSK